MLGLVLRMVWPVLLVVGNGRFCFVQLPTLVRSDLQSIPYWGVVLPIQFSLNSILECYFAYVSFMVCSTLFGILGRLGVFFFFCSVIYRFVLCCCSDDVLPLLIGV